MRALLLVALLVPGVVAAQVDLTPTPETLRQTLPVLSRYAAPGPDVPQRAAAAWCVADGYRLVAETTADRRIARQARRAADRFDAVGTRRVQEATPSLLRRAGASVTVPLAAGVVCRTTVRVAPSGRG